jgi:hypothetical protein
MKKAALFPVLALVAAGIFAQTPVQHQRTYTTVGVSYTKGNDSPWDLPWAAAGVLSRSFTFFDAESPKGGWYWGFGAAAGGRAGNVGIADVWAGTLGWMGNPLALSGEPPALDLDLNLSLSPVLGTRTLDAKFLAGSGYLGAGFSLGISVGLPVLPLVGEGALGLTWDPVVPLARLFGSPEVPNQGYMNLGLTWTMKLNTEIRSLPWKSPGQASRTTTR